MENNHVVMEGRFAEPFVFDHRDRDGTMFCTSVFESRRPSGVADRIPVMANGNREDIINGKLAGVQVRIEGEFCSHKRGEDGRRLFLYVFVQKIVQCPHKTDDSDRVSLKGNVYRPVVYRRTPLGSRITEVILAVARPKGTRSDHIPCIIWGKAADWASHLAIGDQISVEGRIQSRDYKKHMPDGIVKQCTAYEVSAYAITRIKEEKDGN